MPTPTEKFNLLYEEFLKWKNEDSSNKGFWFSRKANYYRKNRHLIGRRSKGKSPSAR